MSSILLVIITSSITASILFLFIIVANIILKSYAVKISYFLMRITLLMYMVPAMLIIFIQIMHNTLYYSEYRMNLDFRYIKHYYNGSSVIIYDEKNYNIIRIIFLIWIIGVFLFGTVRFIHEYFLIKKIMGFNKICDSKDYENIIGCYKRELGIKRNIKIYTNEIVNTPFIYNFINPIVILPDYDFSLDNIKFLLKHELIHLKSRDILYKLLMGMVASFHWFNPLIRMFAKDFFRFSELACDEVTIKDQNKQQRLAYAKLLLDISREHVSEIKITSAFASRSKTMIERRIKNIMNMKKRTRGVVVVSFFMAIVFTVACPVIAYAASNSAIVAYSKILSVYEMDNGKREDTGTLHEEHTEYRKIKLESDDALMSNTRGTNPIDTIVEANGEIQFSPLTLEKGASIRMVLSGDYSSDSFKAGIVNTETGYSRYVNSNNGAVSHTFSITESNEYVIFVENKNDSKEIHLLGSIYVTY